MAVCQKHCNCRNRGVQSPICNVYYILSDLLHKILYQMQFLEGYILSKKRLTKSLNFCEMRSNSGLRSNIFGCFTNTWA